MFNKTNSQIKLSQADISNDLKQLKFHVELNSRVMEDFRYDRNEINYLEINKKFNEFNQIRDEILHISEFSKYKSFITRELSNLKININSKLRQISKRDFKLAPLNMKNESFDQFIEHSKENENGIFETSTKEINSHSFDVTEGINKKLNTLTTEDKQGIESLQDGTKKPPSTKLLVPRINSESQPLELYTEEEDFSLRTTQIGNYCRMIDSINSFLTRRDDLLALSEAVNLKESFFKSKINLSKPLNEMDEEEVQYRNYLEQLKILSDKIKEKAQSKGSKLMFAKGPPKLNIATNNKRAKKWYQKSPTLESNKAEKIKSPTSMLKGLIQKSNIPKHSRARRTISAQDASFVLKTNNESAQRASVVSQSNTSKRDSITSKQPDNQYVISESSNTSIPALFHLPTDKAALKKSSFKINLKKEEETVSQESVCDSESSGSTNNIHSSSYFNTSGDDDKQPPQDVHKLTEKQRGHLEKRELLEEEKTELADSLEVKILDKSIQRSASMIGKSVQESFITTSQALKSIKEVDENDHTHGSGESKNETLNDISLQSIIPDPPELTKKISLPTQFRRPRLHKTIRRMNTMSGNKLTKREKLSRLVKQNSVVSQKVETEKSNDMTIMSNCNLIGLDDLNDDVLERFDIQEAVIEQNVNKVDKLSNQLDKFKDSTIMKLNATVTDLATFKQEIAYLLKINKRERLDVVGMTKRFEEKIHKYIEQVNECESQIEELQNGKTTKCLIEDLKIRMALDLQDIKDRQSLATDKLFDTKLEQNMVMKALRISLLDYRDSKVPFQGQLWEREDLISYRKNLLKEIDVTVPPEMINPSKKNKLILRIDQLKSSHQKKRSSKFHMNNTEQSFLNLSFDTDSYSKKINEEKPMATAMNTGLRKRLRSHHRNTISLGNKLFSPVTQRSIEFPLVKQRLSK